jgi:hypothetical protein
MTHGSVSITYGTTKEAPRGSLPVRPSPHRYGSANEPVSWPLLFIAVAGADQAIVVVVEDLRQANKLGS